MQEKFLYFYNISKFKDAEELRKEQKFYKANVKECNDQNFENLNEKLVEFQKLKNRTLLQTNFSIQQFNTYDLSPANSFDAE